mgnify:CR=1 FL=1
MEQIMQELNASPVVYWFEVNKPELKKSYMAYKAMYMLTGDASWQRAALSLIH